MGREKASNKSRSGILALAASVIILEISAGFIWFDVFASAPQPVVLSAVKRISVPAAAVPTIIKTGEPVRIIIPKIKVNAAIESVGLTPQGAVGVPKNPDNAAWYNVGPMPGEKGSSIISGHLNWYNGASGVFADLSKLKIGDKIMVENDKGELITFVVREKRNYDAAANAVDVFNAGDGKSHLNLVTCAGVWNKRAGQYSKRLIIFTDLLID